MFAEYVTVANRMSSSVFLKKRARPCSLLPLPAASGFDCARLVRGMPTRAHARAAAARHKQGRPRDSTAHRSQPSTLALRVVVPRLV